MKLLIAGAGGHGCVVAETAIASGMWHPIAFLDDKYPQLESVIGLPVIGQVQEIEKFLDHYKNVAAAFGDNHLRIETIRRYSGNTIKFPGIIHPSAAVSPSACLGAGVVVFAQAAVNARTYMGDGVIINTGATIDHDCVIEEGAHISPGVHIAGNVRIGRNSWLGIGSSVIQGIRIGKNVTVGAGAVVIRDIPEGLTVVGVPAKVITKEKR